MTKSYFIIPVFNVAAYLERCISSVISQTIGNFEVLLIDDGSTDGSGRICDVWASRDTRITVIHRKNGGLGAARNTGIETILANHSDGWITFLDSDDWLDPSFLEQMLTGLRETHAQIAVCRYWRPAIFTERAPEDAKKTCAPESLSTQGFFSWCGKRETEGLFLGNMACAKVYDLRLWQTIRFPEDGKAHEDMFTVYKALFSSSGIAVIDDPLYAYFVNPASITGGGYLWTPSRLNAVKAGREQVRYLEERKMDEALKTCLAWHFGRILWNLENMGSDGQSAIFRGQLTEMLRGDWNQYNNRLSPDTFSGYWKVRRIVHPVQASLVDPFRRLYQCVHRKGFRHAVMRVAQKVGLFSLR